MSASPRWLAVAVLVAAVEGLIAAPGSAAEPVRGPRTEFYPTAVGTRWVMRTTYVDDETAYVDASSVVEERIVNGYRKWKVRTVSRPQEKNILLAIAKAFVPTPEDEVFEGWEYYDVGREAYVFRDATEGAENEPAYPMLYVPARAQDVFEDEDGIVTTVIATQRKVKVPAGEFTCYVFEVDFSGEGRTEVARADRNGRRTWPTQFVSLRDDEEAESETSEEEAPAEEEPPAEDDEAADNSIVVEYWARGVGLVRSDDFSIEDDGTRTLHSRQELVSYFVPETAPAAKTRSSKSGTRESAPAAPNSPEPVLPKD